MLVWTLVMGFAVGGEACSIAESQRVYTSFVANTPYRRIPE